MGKKEKKWKSVVEEFYAKGEDFLRKALEYGENNKNSDQTEDFYFALNKPENNKIKADTAEIIAPTARTKFIEKVKKMLKDANISSMEEELYDIAVSEKVWKEFDKNGTKDAFDRQTVFAIVLYIYSFKENPNPRFLKKDLETLLNFIGLTFVPKYIPLDRIVENNIKNNIFDIDEINEDIKAENEVVKRLNRIAKVKFKKIPLLGPQEGKPQPGKKRTIKKNK